MKLEWFAVNTKNKQENVARHHLFQQRIRCLLPFERVELLRHGLRVTQLRPLFPGYVFVQCRWDKHSGLVQAAKAVISFVGYRDGKTQAVAVHPSNIQFLQSRLEEYNGWDVLKKPMNKIEEGIMVQALLGPFRHKPAPAHLIAGNRVELAHPLLGKTITMVYDLDELQVAPSA